MTAAVATLAIARIRSIAWLLGVAIAANPGVAAAQPPAAAADKAAADTLFNEGKKLIARGDDAAACQKFEASLAKLVQLGAQIALAACYEKIGKTASAWGAFRAAASAASKVHDKRQQFAEQHARALEAQLSKLVIQLGAGGSIAGLAIRRDGQDVAPAELGTPVPVDPGDHVVEASAPHRRPWSTTVTVPATPGTVAVAVPALDELPPPPRQRRHIVAYAIGGSGLVVIAGSLVIGALASSKWSNATAHCNATLCDEIGLDLGRQAHDLGDAATITFAIGAAAAATGVVLRLTGPAADSEAPRAAELRVRPSLGPLTGVIVDGRF